MISWLVENMIWASAAMLVVLAIRRPVARLFGAGIAYALWLVPAARLAAPPPAWLPSLIDTPMPSLPPMVIVMDIGSGAALPSPGGPGQWVPILLAVWAGGALFFLAYQGWAYRRFLARLGGSARRVGSHRGVALWESGAVDGPVALGLLRRRIVVPLDFASRYSPEERALALDHERHHHRRGDIFANHVALLVLALNWFNPVAWIAFRAFRADQELSCDAAIAACADRQVRSDYAQALIKSASRPGLIAACPLNGADQLKRRLKMLNHHRKDRRRAWAGGAATIGLIAGSLMLGSPGIAQDVTDPAAGVARREADTNRALVAALQLRRADLIGEAEKSADPAAAKARIGEALKFLDERIKEVQDRAAEPAARQLIYKHEFHRDEQGGLVDRDFHAGTMERVDRCRRGDDELINVEITEAGQSTRVLVCSDSAAPDAHGPVLQRMRERAARDRRLSPEMQQRVLSEIERAIAAERAE